MSAPDPDGRLRPVAAERLIGDLYSVGSTLAACLSMVDEAVADRVTAAIDELDRIAREVRAEVAQNQARGRSQSPGAVPSCDPAELVEQLRRTARQLDRLAASDATGGLHAVELFEAVYRSYGAAHAIEHAQSAIRAAGHPQLPGVEGGASR